MALDKQKILNELGNVVNQLQSADCGCMGKLFSNSNQPNSNAMGGPAHDGYGGCCHGHGCGHGCHGYNASGAGEPFTGNRNCMGFCNPPKLYADTYNYLNQNLMQPVVKEVYDDLKSITPANTMMNNPMGAQMGLSPGNNPNSTPAAAMGGQMGNMAQNQMPGGPMGNQNPITHNHHGPNVRFGNNTNMESMNNTMQMGNPNGQVVQPMTQMPGMGPNIVKMMMGDSGARTGGIQNLGGIPTGAPGNNVPQSPEMGLTSNMPGDIGQGQYNAGMPGTNPGQYNTGNMEMNMAQGNPGAPMQNPTTQYMTQPNMYTGGNANMQGNTMNAMPAQPQMNAIPTQPQMNAHSPNPYGQHSAGIAKFNEMFPGVMQGNLGFDPMAIAIQMNPANQQRAAMDTMQKMMMGNREGISKINAAMMQPVINGTNAATASIAQSNQPLANQAPVEQQQQQQFQQQQLQQQQLQQIPGGGAATIPVQNNQMPQQQVYTTLTGAPTMSQQQVPQQQVPQQQVPQQQVPQQQVPQQQVPQQQQQYQQQYQGQYQQQQQMIDPNTGAVVTGTLPTVYEGSADPNARYEGSPATRQEMSKDPIFPADTSRNFTPPPMKPQRFYQYNTLGQPVEMLPADIYHSPEPNLPQTLSPQQVPSKQYPGRYSTVKSTISKTSLMGNRPVGRTPSRGQLQQIYNQYKGSQSYTQQNINVPDNKVSYSEGHLNVPQGNRMQAPIERVGGDTNANNAVKTPTHLTEQMPGQVGDVPVANKPVTNAEKVPVKEGIDRKVRNGLQDQTYTSYSSSAAWSFHGSHSTPQNIPFRYRNRA